MTGKKLSFFNLALGLIAVAALGGADGRRLFENILANFATA